MPILWSSHSKIFINPKSAPPTCMVSAAYCWPCMGHTITAIVFSCMGCLQGKVHCDVCIEPNPRHPPARYQQHTVGLEWDIPSLPLPTLASASCKEKSTALCAYSLNIFWFPCIYLCTSPLLILSPPLPKTLSSSPSLTRPPIG
jgi:hypothetical protein